MVHSLRCSPRISRGRWVPFRLRPKVSGTIPRIICMLRADSDVSAIRAELATARDAARMASELSSDDRVRDPASRAVEMLEQALATSPGDLEPTDKLTV